MFHSSSALRIAGAALLASVSTIAMASKSVLYIASQNPQAMGILAAQFDSETGALDAPHMLSPTRDPAHFTLSADGGRVYLCNSGTPGGVSAFAVENDGNSLRLLNYKESVGRGPSYVSVDGSGRYVLDANYGGGYVEVYSLTADGALDRLTALVKHEGSSVNPERQTRPYAHWFRTDPSNHFGLVADLGTDRIVVYRFDSGTGELTPNDPPFARVAAGSGPRHLVFHPNGRWLYAAQELSNEVVAFSWDTARGVLTQFQTVKTLPADFTGTNTAAEIATSRDGRFLYVSNRGHDSIAVFAIDAQSGELALRQHAPSRGRVPRYFTFDPSGRWLIVSNQEGGSLTVFAVDAASGELTPRGDPVPVVKPMGVVFLR